MSQQPSCSVTVTYQGDDVERLMAVYKEVVSAIWTYCSSIVNGYVKVHVSPKNLDKGSIEWTLTTATTAGRQTFLVKQDYIGGPVRIINEL